MNVTLGDIIGSDGLFTDGDWVESKDQDPNGNVRLVQLADLGEGVFLNKSSRYLTAQKAIELRCTYLEPGDLLIARMPDPIGRACLFPHGMQPSVTVVDVCILRPDLGKVCPRWLLHRINSEDFRRKIESWLTGSTRQRISRSNLSKIEFSLPSLDEQRRIAAILDKADEMRRMRKCAIDLLDGLTQSIFQQMFGAVPESELKTLADIVDREDRINYGVVQPGDEVSEGVNLVRVSDLKNGRVDHTNLRKVSRAISGKHGRSLLRGTEILISCVGSIGEIAVTSPQEVGFNIARAVARVPIVDDLQRLFVAEYLRSPIAQRYFTKELRTVSQPTLNIKQISETLVPVPHPSKLRKFLERCNFVHRSMEAAQAQLIKMDALFYSLQNRAFVGQL